MEEISDYIGVGYYEQGPMRIDRRNGYYVRGLGTGFGYIEQLRVPRIRGGGFEFAVIRKYKRRHEDVDKVLLETFLRGVSTRKVGQVLEILLEDRLSSSTISRIAKSLDEQVRKFQSRRLSDEYVYLILDGIRISVRGAVKGRKRIILVAYGIRKDGIRELIDFRQAHSENENHWEAFLWNLYRRGLEGKNLKLITVDGAKGLHNALSVVYPFIPIQLCWVHKMRNVCKRIPKKYYKQCKLELQQIYLAKNKMQAIRRFKQWRKKWFPLVPKAVHCMEKDLDMLLCFMDCPENHRTKIRTTNPIERAFREIRRRTKPMSVLSNYASCNRIIYALFSYQNTNWKDRPIYAIKNFYTK
jgi:putative transposase